MSDSHPDFSAREALPPELEAVHGRLVEENLHWQRRLPAADNVTYFAQTIAQADIMATQPAPRYVPIPKKEQIPMHQKNAPMMPSHKRYRLIFPIGATVALVTILAVIFTHLAAGSPTHHGGNVGAAPTTPAVTGTLALHVTATQGWVRPSALDFGKWIAFATQDPLTGYVCGNTAAPGPTGENAAPLRFSVTHDGGATWRELPATPAAGVECQISIDPTDIRDVVLFGNATAPNMYRSHDGGQSWSPFAFPAGENVAVTGNDPVWVGATLFVSVAAAKDPTAIDSSLPHVLAVSRNGAPLAWGDTNSIFHVSAGSFLQVTSTFAIGTTFYAELPVLTCTPNSLSSTSCSQASSLRVKTNDDGATWQQFAIGHTSVPSPDYIIGALADGKTILGRSSGTGAAMGIVSHDDGQTWQDLPATPNTGKVLLLTMADNQIVSTRDGTLYAFTFEKPESNPAYTILKLAPGATAWTTVGVTPGPGAGMIAVGASVEHPLGNNMFATSVDAAGHPNALWTRDNFVANQGEGGGITYHAP